MNNMAYRGRQRLYKWFRSVERFSKLGYFFWTVTFHGLCNWQDQMSLIISDHASMWAHHNLWFNERQKPSCVLEPLAFPFASRHQKIESKQQSCPQVPNCFFGVRGNPHGTQTCDSSLSPAALCSKDALFPGQWPSVYFRTLSTNTFFATLNVFYILAKGNSIKPFTLLRNFTTVPGIDR